MVAGGGLTSSPSWRTTKRISGVQPRDHGALHGVQRVRAREWAYVEDMPLGVAHAASAVVGSKLYVAGGVFTEGLEEGLEDESDQLQIFDGVAWTSEKIELPSFGQDGSFGLFPWLLPRRGVER